MLTATLIIWHRDMLRFYRNRVRLLGGLMFPVLWLLVFGKGLSSSLALPVPGVEFIDFLFPGVIAQFLIFTAMFSAVSILQDREFGFLKEILVAPVPRGAIALGKVLAGATTSFIQALPILIMAPLAGVELTAPMVARLLPAMFLLALVLSAVGVAITSKLKSLDSGQYVFQFLAFPLVMLSGAFFPIYNLPRWLEILTKVNPLTYAVDILRRIVFEYSSLPAEAARMLGPTINGKLVPLWQEIAMVFFVFILLTELANYFFRES